MSWVPSCGHCSTAVPSWASANYVNAAGDDVVLCGDCWDTADGLVCDVCDRRCDVTLDEDSWVSFTPSPWSWVDAVEVVCFGCAGEANVETWPAWVARYGLSVEAGELAMALAGEWYGTVDDLVEAVRVLV